MATPCQTDRQRDEIQIDLEDVIEASKATDEAAMDAWRQREFDFPAFTRRMEPDALDHASGAWARLKAWVRK